MKKAIIDPRQQVEKVVDWDLRTNPPTSVMDIIPDSARVAEVTDTEFPVAEPLFWVDCADDVVADRWYYDTMAQTCIIVPPPPPVPASAQPSADGVQTL